MRSFSKKLAFVLAAAMVVTAFAPAAKAEAASEMAINKSSKILYVTDGKGMNDAAQVGGGKGNVSVYDFSVKNKPADWKTAYSFKWTTDDEDVVSVAKGGVVTAVGVGKATVYCKVTEKATNEVTTLKTTVTVKANAAKVALKNPEVDGTTVDVNGTVDLDRVMYDADGNKTTKRGELVTDYTRWIAMYDGAEAEGVEITQKNGKFTFTEAAPAGDYTLYCETYQSSKYTGTTATSDKVVVTLVKDQNFDVVQNSTTKLTLNFDAPVKTLATADVSVTRLLELTNTTYEYPVVVKSATLAKDGMSATVEVFTKFVDDTKYIIAVNGFESVEKTMSVGNPVSMSIGAKGKDPSYVLTTGEQAELVYTFYDEEGVIVEPANATVIARLETRSTDGSYYLAGKNLTIKKEGVVVVVVADYQGWIENGKRVGAFTASQEFFAMDAAEVVVGGLKAASVNGKKPGDWDASLTMRKSAKDAQLKVILTKTDGKDTDVLTNGGIVTIGNTSYKVTFTAITPDVAVVSSTGAVTAFKTGTASFYVNLHAKTKTGYGEATPIDVINVVVEEDAKFSHIDIDTNAITVGTAANFNTGSVTVTAYDTYNQKENITDLSKVTIKCITDGYGEQAFAGAFTKAIDDGKAKITVNATTALNLIKADLKPAAGEAAVLYFSAVYNNTTVEFSVMIQVPGNADSNYIQVEASASSVDALRVATSADYNNNDWNDNTEKVKNVSFSVFEMNNGVKVADLKIDGKHPGDDKAATVSEGAYVYKVTKDGEDFKGALTFTGSKVSFDLSTTKVVSNSAYKLDVVDYTNLGAGTYEFALYKCYGDGKDAKNNVLVQEYSSVVVVTVGDAGAYQIAGDKVDNDVTVSATYNAADAEEILKCFVINDKSGNAVVKDGKVVTKALYYVDYTAPADSDYVYVNTITFYESVGGAYVPYVVTIDDVLTNK